MKDVRMSPGMKEMHETMSRVLGGRDPKPSFMKALFPVRRKIVTSYVNPPIPTRSCDWCAHYDGNEENGGYGWGATEADAIQDFINNLPDNEGERE